MNEIGFKYLPIIISIILSLFIFSSKPSYSSEVPVLLAMKLECGANKAGGKPFSDYFFAITTDYTFQGNRYWNGSGKYEGDIGQKILNGSRTNKSLLIKGEGKWLKKKDKWKLQFVSKGNKSMFEHLEAGVEGYEGEGKHRRECVLKLLNQVNADAAIQLNSYVKRIAKQKDEIKKLKNQIDNLKKRKKDQENNQDEINKISKEYNEKINNLENLIASLKKENEISGKKIKELNYEIIEIKNNTEFKTKYVDLKKKLDKVKKEYENLNKEIATIEKQNEKNESMLLNYQEKEQEEIKRKEKAEEAKRIALKFEEEKQIEEEKKKEERKINNLKYELGSSELVVAQNLINDLQEFVKNNPDEFDIVEIAELLLENKGVIEGVWEENSQANYNKLSDFVNKSDTFTSYNQTKEEERFALAMDQLNDEYESLVAKQKELEILLNDNLTSEFASEVIDKIKFARTTLEDYSLKELIDSNVVIEEFFIQILNKISEKELEIANKNDEIKRFDSNYRNLELLLSQNLTSENSPFIIEKINSVKNLDTGTLNSTDLSIINDELEVFIEKVENNTLIPKKEEKKIVQNNVITKNTSDQKNGLDISETENQQTNSFEKIENGKVVFKIVYAEDYIKSLDFNDDFGEFSHYGNYVGCTYRIEITNNTDHKIKINTFKISTKDTKLFPDRMSRDALIQYREVIERGQSFVDRGMYKEGGPYSEVDQTKELPSQEQINKWFLQYGCEAQRGNIYIKASDSLDSENIVFTKESGITEGNKNDYLIGSSEGVYPLMEKIILK